MRNKGPFCSIKDEGIFHKRGTSHLAPCSRQLKIRLLEGITGNKCCLHQLLRRECQGGWKWSSHSLELADVENGSFLFAPVAYQERRNIFFPVCDFCLLYNTQQKAETQEFKGIQRNLL